MTTNAKKLQIELTNDEALVIFDWLAQFNEANPLPVRDESEKIALWMLEGRLELTLVEIFSPNYKELLAKAKERVLVRGSEAGEKVT